MQKNTGAASCIVVSALILFAVAMVMFLSRRPQMGSPSFLPQSPNQDAGAIQFKTSETYYDTVEAVLNQRGNNASPPVQMLPKEGSRSAMHHILQPTGKEPPVDIWLSSTKKLIYDLGNAPDGSKYVNPNDSSRIVSLPAQPLVFLVRRRNSDELDSYLKKPNPLVNLPNGKFHYSCADILKSGSGDSIMRYLKWAYEKEPRRGLPRFDTFLKNLKACGFEARLIDSGPLAADFANETTLDFIITHNTLADREIRQHPDLYKIVPHETIMEEPAIVLLQTGYDRHGNSAMDLLKYLKEHIELKRFEGIQAIGNVGDVNDEKRIWELVFNEGRRLDKSK